MSRDIERGSDEFECGVLELGAAGTDPSACHECVLDVGCGAVATFVGTTRATSRGKRVLSFEYEACEAMTGAEMARLFQRCRAEIATAPERA